MKTPIVRRTVQNRSYSYISTVPNTILGRMAIEIVKEGLAPGMRLILKGRGKRGGAYRDNLPPSLASHLALYQYKK